MHACVPWCPCGCQFSLGTVGSYSLNTCCPTWLQALLPAELSLQPQFLYFRLGEQYFRLFSSVSHRSRTDCVITCYLIFETVKLYI